MISLLLAFALAAQPSSLTGQVTDVTGAPLAGATVTVVVGSHRDTTKTGTDGSFRGTPSATTSVRLEPDADNPRSVTPCVVGFATDEEVRR